MLSLIRYRREMSLTSESFLLARGTRGDSTVPAVVAGAIYCGLVNHGGVVNIVNVGNVYIVYRAVVEKSVAFPASALIAIAEVSVAVIDAAVETDLRAPVAVIENISAAAVSPIARGPVVSDSRGAHPGSGHPVVVAEIVVIGPVAGCPHKTLSRTVGLLVYRKGRWSEGDGENHSGGRSCGHSQHHNQQDRQRKQ